MRTSPLIALASAMLVLAPGARAQDTPNIVFGAYYRCNQAQEARTDTLYQQVMAPAWQKQVNAGRISAYGWARHWAGTTSPYSYRRTRRAVAGTSFSSRSAPSPGHASPTPTESRSSTSASSG